MNREIKFRAWEKPDESVSFQGKMHYDVQDQTYFNDWLYSNDYEVMQYTGLKDKVGKEVYEGDIVKGFSGNGVVEFFDNLNWDSGGSVHSGFWCKEWCEYKDPGSLSYHDGFGDCEVIGNIYENPNLLEHNI